MTNVKCFTEIEKNLIIRDYQSKEYTLKKIARLWGCSPRTIGRILEERGLATPVPRLKGEAYQVMQVLKEHGITGPEQLKSDLEIAKFSQDTTRLLEILTKHGVDMEILDSMLSNSIYLRHLIRLAELNKQYNNEKLQRSEEASLV